MTVRLGICVRFLQLKVSRVSILGNFSSSINIPLKPYYSLSAFYINFAIYLFSTLKVEPNLGIGVSTMGDPLGAYFVGVEVLQVSPNSSLVGLLFYIQCGRDRPH